MIEEDIVCPECEYSLSKKILKDEITNEISIEFFCDQAGDDLFRFQILTGLTDDNIAELSKNGKPMRREMSLKLVEHKSEEEVIQEIDATR